MKIEGLPPVVSTEEMIEPKHQDIFEGIARSMEIAEACDTSGPVSLLTYHGKRPDGVIVEVSMLISVEVKK